MNIKEKFWVGTFISLWILVSSVSTIHSVAFFGLSNNDILSWCLAIAFEIGAMASLGGILISKGNKTLIWILFVVLTAFQIHGNMYWAWINSGDISEWTKLFGLTEEDPNFTKRIFAFISGGVLPLVSLGFIKSLMDYMNPNDTSSETIVDSEHYIKPIEDSEKDSIETDTTIIEDILDESLELKTDKEYTHSNSNDNLALLDGIENNQEDSIELNTKRTPTNLGDVIDNAEKTVNSIGEK